MKKIPWLVALQDNLTGGFPPGLLLLKNRPVKSRVFYVDQNSFKVSSMLMQP